MGEEGQNHKNLMTSFMNGPNLKYDPPSMSTKIQHKSHNLCENRAQLKCSKNLFFINLRIYCIIVFYLQPLKFELDKIFNTNCTIQIV